LPKLSCQNGFATYIRCTNPASGQPGMVTFTQLRDTTGVRVFQAITKFLSGKTLIWI
jgi:hypothetical protein